MQVEHPSSYGRLTLKQTLSNKDNITLGLYVGIKLKTSVEKGDKSHFEF